MTLHHADSSVHSNQSEFEDVILVTNIFVIVADALVRLLRCEIVEQISESLTRFCVREGINAEGIPVRIASGENNDPM